MMKFDGNVWKWLTENVISKVLPTPSNPDNHSQYLYWNGSNAIWVPQYDAPGTVRHYGFENYDGDDEIPYPLDEAITGNSMLDWWNCFLDAIRKDIHVVYAWIGGNSYYSGFATVEYTEIKNAAGQWVITALTGHLGPYEFTFSDYTTQEDESCVPSTLVIHDTREPEV